MWAQADGGWIPETITKIKTAILKCNGFNREHQKEVFELLDSLKLQWKPDEKQFEAFGMAKNYTIKFHLDGPDDPIAKILESLYQDLLKLKLASKKSEGDKPIAMHIES